MIRLLMIVFLGFLIGHTSLKLFFYLTGKYLNFKPKNFIAFDKQLHFGAGATIFILVAFVLSIEIGIIAAIIAGILKEIYDYFRPEKHTACIWDVFYTILGAFTALLLLVI